uniref:BPTI/Kunitz inhibitor domain-containing protein n=1 Tax=Parastrongyloides trichosuri TaxID=131310 RepID=A0A0N4ZCG5_PARTI
MTSKYSIKWVILFLLNILSITIALEEFRPVYDRKTILRRQKRNDEGLTDKDKLACKELNGEYRKVCGTRLPDKESKDFCDAYENVCFEISANEPDQNTVPTPTTTQPPFIPVKTTKHKTDWVAFCKEYKPRFLYVCPDPFKYGQKAIVFCPLYSERCNLAVPERPVYPNGGTFSRDATANLCSQYRGFAARYCNNPLAMTQPNVRDGCEKYARFCTGRG